MKALRVTLSALFVFVMLQAACSRKQADGNAANAPPQADGASQQQQQQGAPQAPVNADARALFDRGVDAYRHDRDEEAVEVFKQAVQLDPDFAEAHYRLGLALHAAGQGEEADKAYAEAVKAYEKMTKRDEKDSDAFYFLGLCYEKLDKYDDAVKALKEAVKNSPVENDDKYFELALAQYKLAQYDDSVRALNKALEINPDNFPAQELLEQAKSGAARVEEFRKRQEQLRKQQTGNAGNSNGNSNGNNSNSGVNTNSGARANRNGGVSAPT
jgi:tetratricopeptide (TPR) repeat protein